jgi:hypothetical protein
MASRCIGAAAVLTAVCGAAAALPFPYVMPLLPAPPPAVQCYKNASLSSWGGSVLEVPDDPYYRYHLYVDAFVEDCGLNAWTTNSEVAHGMSDSPLGPFTFFDVALPVYHHNAAAVRHTDGTFLLFSIGMSPEGPIANFTPADDGAPPEAPRRRLGPRPLSHGAELIECWYAPTPYGPWTQLVVDGSINLFNGTNPAPWVMANGTTVVGSHNNQGFTVSVAADWRGPYSEPYLLVPYSDYNNTYVFEDPYLWQDAASGGVWRLLLHQYNASNPADQVGVGGYAVSATPDLFSAWALQPSATPAYNTTVQFADGSNLTMARRERPKLLLNATMGAPAVLYNGVCPPGTEACWTLAQAIAL